MEGRKYTLVTDGSSDRALMPILDWIFYECGVEIQGVWADLRRLVNSPTLLSDRIQRSLELYPCDLLFVHRDAENLTREDRINEISEALNEIAEYPEIVCVVPVRMTEAWLLFDEAAIRRAAGNPNGRDRLNLPSHNNLEDLPNPKQVLHQSLRQASGLPRRRMKRFRVHERIHRLANLIDDFSPLRELPAFHALESDIQGHIEDQGWGGIEPN